MTLKKLSTSLIIAHESVELLLSAVKEGVADSRFKLFLVDARKFRDLVQDIEIMAARAGRESIKIPCDLPVIGKMQKTKLAVSKKIN